MLHKSLRERDGIYYSLGFQPTKDDADAFCTMAAGTRNYNRPVISRPKGYAPEWWVQ